MGVGVALSIRLITTVHTGIAGRVRVSVVGLRHSERMKTVLERTLAGRNGIRSVSASIWTGNILIFHDPGENLAQVLAALEATLDGGTPIPFPEVDQAPLAVARRAASGGGMLAFFKDLFGWLLGNNPQQPERGPSQNSAQPVAIEPRVVPEPQAWHTMTVGDTGRYWRTSLTDGLPSLVAKARLAEFGSNSLPAYKGRSPLTIFLGQLKSLPVLMLLGSAALSVITGGIGDAAVIVLVVALNACIGFATEMQAERTIAALLDYGEPFSTVVRDGTIMRIRGEEVVPGDLLILTRGSQVTADARVVEARYLTIDESTLTGESMPVEKSVAEITRTLIPIAERSNMLFRGTVVTGGSGLAIAVATGRFTEIGQVQRLIAEAPRPDTPLERQLAKLSNQLAWVTLIVAGTALVIGLLRGFSVLQILKSAIALAVAAVPEGLPVVATTALASTVHAMLRYNVLIRRLDAIEALGNIQVVCFDKTGTLTLNSMTVMSVFAGMRQYLRNDGGGLLDASVRKNGTGHELRKLIEICALCSDAEVNREQSLAAVKGSPTETALIEMAIKAGVDVAALRARYPLLDTEQRTEHRNYMTTRHDAGGGRTLVAIKGAPSEVLSLCAFYASNGRVYRLSKRSRKIIEAENVRMADCALRVLGCASFETQDSAQSQNGHLTWLGLVGMADPPRKGLQPFIRALRDAGIRPVMITGDQSATAEAVGRTLDLNRALSTAVLDAEAGEILSSDELARRISTADIFSRVNPSDKLRIVKALQSRGAVVAMTGDGINDGPALKAADVGITLGKSGTQVAREVADIVLLDDNLQTLLPAIRDGRRIHENIRTAIHYISATNASEVALMLISLAIGTGAPLSPRQLLWINVVTDIFPELAVAVQPAERDIMQRPPRDPNASAIGSSDLPRLGRQCGVITAAALACYVYGVARYGVGPQASTVAFLGLAAPQLLHAFSARSETHTMFEASTLAPNHLLQVSVIGALAALTIGQFIPGIRSLLGSVPIGIADYVVCAAAGLASLLINEMFKGAAIPATQVAALPASDIQNLSCSVQPA